MTDPGQSAEKVLEKLSNCRRSARLHIIVTPTSAKPGVEGTESAGINRHIVGDERALQKRRSDSILASSLACDLVRDHSEA
jgi:hypothetical protein